MNKLVCRLAYALVIVSICMSGSVWAQSYSESPTSSNPSDQTHVVKTSPIAQSPNDKQQIVIPEYLDLLKHDPIFDKLFIGAETHHEIVVVSRLLSKTIDLPVNTTSNSDNRKIISRRVVSWNGFGFIQFGQCELAADDEGANIKFENCGPIGEGKYYSIYSLYKLRKKELMFGLQNTLVLFNGDYFSKNLGWKNEHIFTLQDAKSTTQKFEIFLNWTLKNEFKPADDICKNCMIGK